MKSIGTHRSYQIKTICNAPIELIDGDRGKNYPKQHDFSSSGYCLFLNAGNVTKSGLDFHECAFISEEKDSLLGKGKLRRGDIIVTTRGTLGNIGYYDKSAPYDKVRINSGMIILRPLESELEATFLYCYLRSALFQSQVTKLSSGSAQPQLPIRDFRNIEIPLPPLPEQRRIAHILGTLDDKIENNRKTAKSLEAMAQAIFKSWFVDFDPVRAKMNGEPKESICKRLKITPEILDLFPDRLVDSELGEIPEGWNLIPLSDIFIEKNARDTNKDYPEFASTNYGLIPRNSVFKKTLSGRGTINKIVEQGDFVFGLSRSVLNFGMMRNNIGSVSPAYKVFSLRRGMIRPVLLELMFRNNGKYYYQVVSASSREGQAISNASFSNVFAPSIPAALQELYIYTYKTIDALIVARDHENLKIKNFLETLLPKLISGEIRVPEAKYCVEAAMSGEV